MSSYDAVKLDIEGAIAIVTLNRPDAMNAFNQDVYRGLKETALKIKELPELIPIVRELKAGI